MRRYPSYTARVGAAVLFGCGASVPGVAGRPASIAPATVGGATAPGGACASPQLPVAARLALAMGPHPVAHSLDDGARRVVVVAPSDNGGGGDRARLVVVGPVARIGRRLDRSAGAAMLIGVARLSYRGSAAHLCLVGPAYLRDEAGRVGPAAQGLHLDMVVDGVSLLARADIWTASTSYHVVGRLTPVPVPALDPSRSPLSPATPSPATPSPSPSASPTAPALPSVMS